MNSGQTILLGDLSGLQDFLFDVAAEGGGQARRLRARSLFISLLTEAAALRLLEAVGWPKSQMVFSAAGKFLLAGPSLHPPARNEAARVAREISAWLFAKTGAALRLALAITDVAPGRALPEAYDEAQRSLQRAKWQPWGDLLNGHGGWAASDLVLPPISPPCDLCRRRPGRRAVQDDDGGTRVLCDRCFDDGELGRRLPKARWIEVLPRSLPDTADVLGFGVRTADGDRPSMEARHAFSLTGQYPLTDGRIIPRRLARHVPRLPSGEPVEFKDLAARAEGTPLLGVLKLDADNLGAAFRKALQGAPDFVAFKRLSERLDDFFAAQVDEILARPPWDSLYMVFSGGDDLLLVGPWNVAFDFAGHVRQSFARTFAGDGLTLSGGLTLIKPTFPIRSGADQADSLLDDAKSKATAGATAPKDQMAAFGQVWKWRDHTTVVDTARQLADWVRQGAMPRGWLHTLLDLAEARNRGDALPVTARLAYHVGRNYPSPRAEGAKGDLRRWADALLADFDAGSQPETRLLPAILRHALTATRSKFQDEP
jgi:CRISPR-associated protein Csm1